MEINRKNYISKILIAGASSSAGKTTLSCGLLCALSKRGLKISAYKTGPDYIDPQHLRLAGNCEAFNLDTWLMNENLTRKLFAITSHDKDFALIEGAMGLYDGGIYSTANIAKLLNVPVILVINAKSLGESVAAVASGFRDYDKKINFAGVIINFAGSDSHVKIIAESLERANIKFLGALKRSDNIAIPERHLGLLPTHEQKNFDSDKLADIIEKSINLDEIIRIAKESASPQENFITQKISSCRKIIAIARDEAFNFYYPESLMTLKNLGAELIYFSPIHDKKLPRADSYIFGGGFPEIFARELAANISMLESVRSCDKKILAECGGFMYLCRSLEDLNGEKFNMTGLINANSFMTNRPVIGYLEARALRNNIICGSGEILRGHEFHYSRIKPDSCAFEFTRPRTGETHTGGYAMNNILASYLHINFFGNERFAANFLTSSRL
ncbi:MAG: cobyrinate a,c-diamide synthase [Synergistaceae bacterium]|nr:cobyrinate a,c-diamide synthase [Synergistaceae bacterium]